MCCIRRPGYAKNNCPIDRTEPCKHLVEHVVGVVHGAVHRSYWGIIWSVLWHEREHRGTGKLRSVGAVCLLSRGSDAYLPPQQRRRGVRRRLLLPFAQPSREHSRGAGAPRPAAESSTKAAGRRAAEQGRSPSGLQPGSEAGGRGARGRGRYSGAGEQCQEFGTA